MNPAYDFSGQVVLVTGAGAGMGLDTARAFATAGAVVVLADVNDDALRTATDELTAAGHRALGVVCDVADEDQVAALVDRTVAEFGRLDMAFNNAGIMLPLSDAADEPAENFDRVTAINLRGVWTCVKHELRQMRAQGGGAIVNCSSLGGLVGNPGRASYHATKHGVLGLTKSAALECARAASASTPSVPAPSRPRWSPTWSPRENSRSPTLSPTSRSAASDAERRSPPLCCGCAARAQASWSASRCPSTAATPPAERRARRPRPQ
jgi:NAD(P)-dependent dehydrogenase (short-subunit alcohol dehydrogenase family)